VPDPTCKRITKAGKPCPAPPSFPSGLCIKHKAKLDWDRRRQERKLEAELELRRQKTNASRVVPMANDPRDISDLVGEDSFDDSSTQVSMRMWGEADLFARSNTQQSYFHTQHLNNPPTYSSQVSPPTPGLHSRVSKLRLFRTCLVLAYVAAFTITSSLIVALWWSFKHNDASGGFTMAGYMVAVGGIIMYPIQSRHSKGCTCWKKNAQTPGLS
jgi:hypothetical protein